MDFTAALIHLRQQIPALTLNEWWEEGDGNVCWLNKRAQPLEAREWQSGVPCLQILLSDRWLITLNATDEVVEITLPQGEWRLSPHLPERIIRSL
ncbi:Glycogen debranching enzyme [Leclercia adecarboxylata]|uniref:Glycogen debranching enzyme n=1 Tax=Leclercia adecarboxylata TaxID=83655 RepID=A0A4V6YYC6_9ENTR|nr:Glycogen debranching enzyme [Leclercia adecarboxylata]